MCLFISGLRVMNSTAKFSESLLIMDIYWLEIRKILYIQLFTLAISAENFGMGQFRTKVWL